MTDFEKDLEKLKKHSRAIEKILNPYILDDDILQLEKDIIEGYKKLYALKVKMITVQKDMSKKAYKIDTIVKSYMRNSKEST